MIIVRNLLLENNAIYFKFIILSSPFIDGKGIVIKNNYSRRIDKQFFKNNYLLFSNSQQSDIFRNLE